MNTSKVDKVKNIRPRGRCVMKWKKRIYMCNSKAKVVLSKQQSYSGEEVIHSINVVN